MLINGDIMIAVEPFFVSYFSSNSTNSIICLVKCSLSLFLLCFPFQTTPSVSFSDDELASLTDRIQNAGTEVVNAKAGAVSHILKKSWHSSYYLLKG